MEEQNISRIRVMEEQQLNWDSWRAAALKVRSRGEQQI
jgi:hypothetical protein